VQRRHSAKPNATTPTPPQPPKPSPAAAFTTHHPKPPQQRSNPAFGTAKNGVFFSLFSRFRFFGAPKNGASILPNSE
jgi:hypothetical protein